MLSLIYLYFIIFLSCYNCENLLEKVISNPIRIYNRENRVLFAVSNDCSNEIYQNLMQNFMSTEEIAKNTTTRIANYNTVISFGGVYNKTLEPYDSLEDVKECLDVRCYTLSRVNNVTDVVTQFIEPINRNCITEPTKYYTLIISDQCLTFLNINLNENCPGEYQFIGLMLPTVDDVINCKKKILQEVDGREIHLKIFTFNQNNQINDDSFSYTDMNIKYYSTMATSKINIFVLSENVIELIESQWPHTRIPHQALRCKFTKLKFGRCLETGNESAIGYFQYGTYNEKPQNLLMTTPLNFENADDIIDNYNILLPQNAGPAKNDCKTIQEYLINLNNLELDSPNEQYNLLILDDWFPKCVESFKLEWNNTNRHLDIIVMYNGTLKNDYMNYISFPNNSLNHLNFYQEIWWEDGYFNGYCDFDPFCTTFTNISNKFLRDIPPKNILLQILIIIFAVIISIFVLALFGYSKRQMLAKTRKNWIKERVETVTSFATKKLRNDQYWNLLLDDQNIIINYEKVLGKGSKATVYQSYLKKPFCLLSNIKVAAKISNENSVDSEFVDELNSLISLKQHENIILLIGWTMIKNDTVIVTELAESNLFEYLQINRYHTSIMKWSLQILWQISNALEFVANNDMIHRDVACRNILIFNKNLAKLADFGLCCKCKKNETFKDSTHKKFPLKWLSIEALNDRIFSEKSDAWAFGILCYEVFSHGNIPYAEISNSKLIDHLESGKRLQKPLNVAPHIYDLMLLCWNKNPKNRPNFKEIRKNLEVVLEYGYLPLEKSV